MLLLGGLGVRLCSGQYILALQAKKGASQILLMAATRLSPRRPCHAAPVQIEEF
jgi:hypothetical protein